MFAAAFIILEADKVVSNLTGNDSQCLSRSTLFHVLTNHPGAND